MRRVSGQPARKAPYLCTVELSFQERNAPGANLYLTARFADDVVEIGPIRIRVALARAYLNFVLQNCHLPLDPELDHVWPARQDTRSAVKKLSVCENSTTETEAAALSAGALISAATQIGSTSKAGFASSTETQTTFHTSRQHTAWRGTSKIPSLVFEARPTQDFLSGTLVSEKLIGSLEPGARSYGVGIELEVPKSGLMIEDGDHFEPYPNKRGLMKIVAAVALCRKPVSIYHARIAHGRRTSP